MRKAHLANDGSGGEDRPHAGEGTGCGDEEVWDMVERSARTHRGTGNRIAEKVEDFRVPRTRPAVSPTGKIADESQARSG